MLRTFRAEWLKLRRPGVVWGGAGTIIGFTILFTCLVVGNVLDPDDQSPRQRGPGLPTIEQLESPEGLSVGILLSGQLIGIVALVLMAASLGNEFGFGTLKVMLSREPRRLRLLVGKVLAMVAFVACATVAAFLLQAAAGALVGGLRDLDLTAWGTLPAWTEAARVVSRVVGGAAAWTVLGAGLAMLFRAAPPAIGVGIGYTVVAEPLLVLLWGQGLDWLPGQALSTLIMGGTPAMSLAESTGITAAYSVIVAAATAIVFVRRDVSD